MKKLNVLYLDDEPNNLLVFDASFRRHYQVKTTTDPDQALLWISNGIIDVVITDQVMPAMSGTEFLKKVREINNNIPRLLLTGYMASEIDRGLVHHVLSKPWDKDHLLHVIAEAMTAP